MFYNSKKLIDEKVLQQYFFEKFMLADSKERKALLPNKFSTYSSTTDVKGLNPEVSIGITDKGTKHTTDFVLYTMPSSKLSKLNIELKWDIKDFEKQKERFPYYNGTIENGFCVAIKEGDYRPKSINDGKIPVVYLDSDDFKKWFTKKSHSIVAQALSNKLGNKPSRLTGEKFWVVSIVKASKEHYLKHGSTNNIWAFRDNNNPSNIMNILGGDYVIFVKLGHCRPGRAFYPDQANKKFDTSRGKTLRNEDISWDIDLLDIRKVERGYHLNYTDKKPYEGFDEQWLSKDNRFPQEKDYTQFITFSKNSNDHYEYIWNRPAGYRLDRKLFTDKEQIAFVDALRTSLNTRGDAIELNRAAFESLLHIIGEC